MKKLYKILKDGEMVESEIPGFYAGWKVGRIFGKLNCWSGRRMFRNNRVFFHTLEDAVREGYRPCKHCKPMSESDFVSVQHLIPGIKTLEDFYNLKK